MLLPCGSTFFQECFDHIRVLSRLWILKFRETQWIQGILRYFFHFKTINNFFYKNDTKMHGLQSKLDSAWFFTTRLALVSLICAVMDRRAPIVPSIDWCRCKTPHCQSTIAFIFQGGYRWCWFTWNLPERISWTKSERGFVEFDSTNMPRLFQ